MLDLLSQGWVGTTIGAVGVVLAVVFYLRTRPRPGLAYQAYGVTLVGGRSAAFPKEVEIRFGGTVVPRITATRIIVWNCGNQTIRGDDIVQADPLRIKLEDEVQLLKHEILRANRQVNGWQTELGAAVGAPLLVRFDFLDPGDGVVIETVHTGTASRCDLAGTIRGIPGGLRNYGRPFWPHLTRRGVPFPLRPKTMMVVVVAIGSVITLLGLATAFAARLPPPFNTLARDPDERVSIDWALVVAGGLYVAMGAFVLWAARRRYPSSLELIDDDQPTSGPKNRAT